MAISSTSPAQSLNSGIFVQVQQQQAQRSADQAERQARSLQAQARDAQTVASRAQENARSLKVQANQAQGEASSARQGLVALKSGDELQTQLGGLHDQISAILKPETDSSAISSLGSAPASISSASALVPVINSFGQSTGALVNVIA